MTQPNPTTNTSDEWAWLDDVLLRFSKTVAEFAGADVDDISDAMTDVEAKAAIRTAILVRDAEIEHKARLDETLKAHNEMMQCDGFVGDDYQPLLTYLEQRKAQLQPPVDKEN